MVGFKKTKKTFFDKILGKPDALSYKLIHKIQIFVGFSFYLILFCPAPRKVLTKNVVVTKRQSI